MKLIGILSTTALFLILGWNVPADARQEQQDKPKNQQQQDKPAAQQQQQHQRQQAQAPKQQQQQARGQQNQQRQQQRQQQNNSAQQQQRQQQAQAPNQQQQRQQQARGQQGQQSQQRQQQNNAAQQQHQQQARGQQNQQRQQRQQQNNSTQQQDYRSAQQRSPAQVHRQQVAWQGDRANSWQSQHRTWQQRGGYNGYRVPDARFRSYYGQDHGFRIYSLPVRYVGGHRRFRYGGYWFGLVDPWPEYWSNDWYDSDDVYVDYYGDGYYLYNRRYPGDRIAISFYLN